jgi:hypothetical protein
MATTELEIHSLTRLPQLRIDHLGTVSAVPLGQGHDLCAQCHIPIQRRRIAQRTGAHLHHTQRAALRQALAV